MSEIDGSRTVVALAAAAMFSVSGCQDSGDDLMAAIEVGTPTEIRHEVSQSDDLDVAVRFAVVSRKLWKSVKGVVSGSYSS